MANKTKKFPIVRRIRNLIASERFTFFIVTLFMLKYKQAPVAQRIEQTRPKGKMEVQFPPGVQYNCFDETGCSSSVERSVRDREVPGSIPCTPTNLTNYRKSFSINLWQQNHTEICPLNNRI